MFPDYQRFHGLALKTRDVDPVYPVLKDLADTGGLSEEDRIRLVMLHVAYYHMGSALAAFEGRISVLPCATERRGHRDPKKLQRHLDDLKSIGDGPGGFSAWFSYDLRGEPRECWNRVTERLLGVYGNGRWAAFKTAEMLWKVCGFPIQAPDMGHAYSSGPRQGLKLLVPNLPEGNSRETVRRLDELSEELCVSLRESGLAASVEEVETTLCDFHALVEGRYYVGHDIDQMLRQLLDVQSGLTKWALASRREVLPEAYLGEVHGWSGPDRERKSVYKRTGKIVER